MIKDRLEDLKRKNRRNECNDQSTADQDEDEDFVEIDMSIGRGPSYIEPLIKRYIEIVIDFEGIQSNVDTLKSMLEAKNAHQFNEDEFNKVRQKNMQLNNNVVGKFKKLESKLPKANDYRTKARMQRALYYGYFYQYAQLWTKHEEILLNYEQKLKKNLKMQSKILNYNLTDEEIDTLIENKQTNLLMDNILTDTETARQQLQELKNRLNELVKLEKSISEVHGLFIRLQTMVVEQGEVMQSIEKHFDDARDHIASGLGQLVIAKEIAEKRFSLRRKLILVGIVLVVLLLLFGINSIRCFMFCKKK